MFHRDVKMTAAFDKVFFFPRFFHFFHECFYFGSFLVLSLHKTANDREEDKIILFAMTDY